MSNSFLTLFKLFRVPLITFGCFIIQYDMTSQVSYDGVTTCYVLAKEFVDSLGVTEDCMEQPGEC